MAEPDMSEIERQARAQAAGNDPTSTGVLRAAEVLVYKDWLIEQDATNKSALPLSAKHAHEKAVGEYHSAILKELNPKLITGMTYMKGKEPTMPEDVVAAAQRVVEAKKGHDR